MAPIPHLVSVMSPFPWTVQADATVAEARARMEAEGFRHLPVIRGQELVGVLTKRDLAHLDGETPVESAAGPAHVLPDSVTLLAALETMVEHHGEPVLVVRGGKLVGILTPTDVCRLLGDVYRGDGGGAAA